MGVLLSKRYAVHIPSLKMHAYTLVYTGYFSVNTEVVTTHVTLTLRTLPVGWEGDKAADVS